MITLINFTNSRTLPSTIMFAFGAQAISHCYFFEEHEQSYRLLDLEIFVSKREKQKSGSCIMESLLCEGKKLQVWVERSVILYREKILSEHKSEIKQVNEKCSFCFCRRDINGALRGWYVVFVCVVLIKMLVFFFFLISRSIWGCQRNKKQSRTTPSRHEILFLTMIWGNFKTLQACFYFRALMTFHINFTFLSLVRLPLFVC